MEQIALEINCETGEEVIRILSSEETALVNENIKKALEVINARNEQEENKVALLARLGITEEEAKLLIS